MSSKVLIVEDDSDTVKLVDLYLRRDGHKVLTATDGLEGLRLAREARPDLVVLDLMLPGMNGLEVCRTLCIHNVVGIPLFRGFLSTDFASANASQCSRLFRRGNGSAGNLKFTV